MSATPASRNSTDPFGRQALNGATLKTTSVDPGAASNAPLSELPPELSFSNDACDTSDSALADAQGLRRAVGLPSDAATIAASLADPAYRCTAFGVLLTDNELAEFATVLAAQGELSDLAAAAAKDPAYAGAYLEGSTLTIASTDGNLGRSFKPAIGLVRLVRAEYTYSELQRVAFEIARNTSDMGPNSSIRLTRVSVNPKTNRVDLGVDGDVDNATEHYRRLYGDIVTVKYEPLQSAEFLCTTDDCGTKGGLSVDHFTGGKQDSGCTSGFVPRYRYPGGSWKYGILTAGHCIKDAGGVNNANSWQNGAGTIVWGNNKAQDFWWNDCSFSTLCNYNDEGLFGLGGVSPGTWNKYKIGGSSSVAIDAWTDRYYQLIGQIVYRHGRTTGQRSGAITDKPEVYSYYCPFPTNCVRYGLVRVDVASDRGDSGAGFYRLYSTGGIWHRSAYGILSAGPPGSSPTYYVDAAGDMDLEPLPTSNNIHVFPCITAGCT